jgi:hypothetical protein
VELVVSGSEREALKRLARQPSTPQAIAASISAA